MYSNHKDGRIRDLMPMFRRGFFALTSVSSLEVKCRLCDHLLSEHQDFRTDSSPMEILASAGKSNQTQQDFWKPPSNPTRCLRKDTVSKLAAAVDSQIVILIRGTPASGKTVLSQLLRDYYLENNRKVFLLETWKPLECFHGQDP